VSGARKLLLSGTALTALLAVVAVASRAHRPGGRSGTAPAHPPALIADYLSTLALIALPFGALLVVWVLAHRRLDRLQAGRANWRHTFGYLAVFALLLGAGLWGSHLYRKSTSPRGPTIPSLVSPTQGSKGKSSKGQSADHVRFRWLPVIVLASLGVALAFMVGAAVVRRRLYGEGMHEQALLAAALDEVLADTLDDLRAERDPRRAVIRVYARMERTFAAYGVPREESEAPLEYLARVLDSIQVSAFSVRRLTQLFERAKFSPHEIDSGMKDDAIEALAGLRAELEHGRAAA
jgi:hypothetical protein